MLCKVLHRYTAKIFTDAGDDLHGGEQPGRLHDRPLAMDPMQFNGIQPGTFKGQAPDQEAYTAVALDLLMMGPDPGTDLPTDMPGGIVPQQHQDTLPLGGQPLTEPCEQGGRDVAHGSAIDKAQQNRVGVTSQPPIAGQGCGRCISFRAVLLDQSQGRAPGPTVQGWLGQTTPPGLIGTPRTQSGC
jgi:hypothetical protein